MTKQEFAQCMAFLGACLDRQISADTHRAWFAVLGDMEKKTLERAIVAVVRGHKFSGLPPIGLLLQAAGASVGVIDADAQALLAWDRVFKAAGNPGGYATIDWGEPAIPAAIESVGESWPKFCEITTDELIRFIKPKFVEAWKAHRAAGTNCGTVSLGIIARDAGRLGYNAPEPLRLDGPRPAVIGFGGEKVAALPGPAQSRRLTVAETVANRMAVVDDEPERAAEQPPEQQRKRQELPTQEEWHGRLEAQKRALQVKYGVDSEAMTGA